MLMSGTVLAVYQLLEASSQTSEKSAIQEEGSFVIRKIRWALTGAQTASAGGTSCARTMHVARYDGTTIDLRLASNKVEMSENSGTYYPLTTDNVSVSCFEVSTIGSGSILGVAATTTIDSLTFATNSYLR